MGCNATKPKADPNLERRPLQQNENGQATVEQVAHEENGDVHAEQVVHEENGHAPAEAPAPEVNRQVEDEPGL